MLFYNLTLMASRFFVNNYRGKMGIQSITFAKRAQYSQKLRDIYVTISDAQKLSTLREFPRIVAQYEYTIWCK
jgi:hypothetical protein